MSDDFEISTGKIDIAVRVAQDGGASGTG